MRGSLAKRFIAISDVLFDPKRVLGAAVGPTGDVTVFLENGRELAVPDPALAADLWAVLLKLSEAVG